MSFSVNNTKNKSILLIGNFLSRHGGSRGVSEDLSEKLQTGGWVVFTASNKKTKLMRLLSMLWAIWNYRSDYSIAHIDVFSGPAFLWAEFSSLFLKFLNKPFILTLHGGNLPEFSKHHSNRVNRVLKPAHKVVAPSYYLQQKMNVYCNDIQIIHNPISLNKYSYRKRYHPKTKLVWLRAFHEIYNPSLAPKVLLELKTEYQDIQLYMIGPDKDDGSFKKLLAIAEENNVLDYIEFVGGVQSEQVPLWLEKGDIFLNTTNVDNTPVSVIEAMACGLCIVSTNVGGIPCLLEEEVEALLVPPDDPTAMAAAVRRILTEPGLAGRLSRNARRKAEQYDWEIILPQWEALFQEVLNRG